MKKCLALLLIVCFGAISVSWDFKAHRVIARIAEKHLTAHTKAILTTILNGQSLADLSTYPDEIKNNPDYNYTAAWHYITVPAGLNYDKFKAFVLSDKEPNIYISLVVNIGYLKDPATIQAKNYNRQAMREYLIEWLTNLVGDSHNPVNVGELKKWNRNTISDGVTRNASNIHKLWDTDLIEHSGLNYIALADSLDNTVTASQVKQLQNDTIIQWLYESYQLSSEIYLKSRENGHIDETYYNEHFPIAAKRMTEAGIRLAGILNNCLDHNPDYTVN